VKKTNILIVEDERIIARDIQHSLENLGYAVPAIVSSGKKAIEKATEIRPHLILMDIRLKGEMDGVEAAERIRAAFDIPVIYLTAYADDETLQRARITEPFGYILKPFEEREVHSVIQMALYKHEAERKLKEQEARFRALIENSSDIILLLDGNGVIQYASLSVERVLGYRPEEMTGKSIFEFLHSDDGPEAVKVFVQRLQDWVILQSGEGRYRRKDGSWRILETISHNRLADPAIAGIVVNARDVTERKQAERALQESEEKYRDLVENISDVIYTVDKNQVLTYVSPAIEPLIGYRPSELLGRPFSELVYQKDLPRLGKSFQSILSGHTAANEYRIVTRSGKARWMRASSRPIFMEGRVIGGQGVLTDITERKQAEKEIRQRTAQLEALRQVELELTAQLDLDTLLYSIVSQAAKLLGGASGGLYLYRPEQDVLEWSVSISPNRVAPVGTILRRGAGLSGKVWETGQPLIVDNYRDWEGRAAAWKNYLLAVSVVGVPIRWGEEFLGVLNVGADVPDAFSPADADLLGLFATQAAIAIQNARLYEQAQQEIIERKQVEEALWQRNRELALLNQIGQAFTVTLDLDQVLVTVLEEVRRLLDVAACSIWLAYPETEELVCQQAIGPQSKVVRGWRLALGEGLAGWAARSGESLIVSDTRTDERHFKSVDQQTGVEMRAILSAPLRVKQDVIGVLQIADTEVNRFRSTDLILVESLAASAAIAIENARLVEALHHYTAELEARNEELDAFAHTVAHDLKNPVGLVIGFANVLEGDCITMPREKLQEYLRVILRNGHKINNIIDELLLLAGLRQVKVALAPLDMASIVAEACGRLTHMIEESQAEIILPDTSMWPEALGYAPWVEEVWTNYLSNALKYGDQPPRVELGATVQPDGMVRFWIHNSGPGLTPEEQTRLFTPFTRLDQARAKGHGLGLSIVRRIVEKLGGQVGVDSKENRGSIFTFTLPGTANIKP
jgi:PAS domain S-box-containing protein